MNLVKKVCTLVLAALMLFSIVPSVALAVEEAAAPMTVTVNGVAMEVKYVENSNNQNWYFVTVTGSNFEISGTTDNPIKKANNVAVTDNKATVALSALKANDISKIPADVAACAKADTTQLYVCSFEFANVSNLPNGNQRGNLFIEMGCDHNWLEAGCTTGETCEICGIEKTGSYPAGHKLLGDGTCENCEATVPAISVTANGKPVEVAYTTASSSSVLYLEIYEGSDIQIVKTGDGAYTDNYTWDQIKAAYQTTTRADGSPGWLDWPDNYKLPMKTDVENIVNMPYIQRRTNSTGTAYDFYVISVIAHPDHSYVDGECTICGKACEHSWNAETGICSTCSAECAHETYADGVCSVCGMAEPVVDLSLFTITVNGEAAPVYAGMTSKNKLRHGTTITGTSLTITTKDGSVITQVKDATKNRITGENYLVTNDTSSITIDLSKCSSTDLVTAKYPTEVNFPFGTDTTIYRLNATVNGASQQIYVEVLCDHENWQEAGCSTPEVCLDCGKFASYPAHKLLGDGTCENCETTVPAISVTTNGKPVELSYTTAKSGYAYTGVLYMEIYEGSDIQIVKTGDGAYTDNYTWDQIKAAYQTTTRADGSPGWLDWPDSYKLPMKTDVENIVNMPYIQRRTNSTGTTYDFYVISVIAHPDHSYVDGECTICGKACEHSWNAETGICSTCSAECAHETYADGVCSVCGMAEPVVDLSLFTITVNGEAAPVYAAIQSSNSRVRHGTTITGKTLTITTKDGSKITGVADTQKNASNVRYEVTNDASSITLDLSQFVGASLETVKYLEELNFPFNADNTFYKLNVYVDGAAYTMQLYIEIDCDHANWQEAGCTTPAGCPDCGKSEGYPAGHKLLGDGTCENCETTVPAISVTANGKPVELSYTTAKSGSAYTGVLYMEIYEGSDLQIVKTGDGAYTDNYTWDQIKAKYQTTTRADGSPGWLDWPDSYKLPMKTDVENIVNMPYIQRRTNSTGTTYDFYVISVIAHPDHSYVDGECTICGACEHAHWSDATCEQPKTCDKCGKTEGDALGHSWNAETGICSACGTACEHAEYENDVCKVCGMAKGPDALLGDVNGDGKVNNIDATLVLRYSVGGLTEEQLAKLDVSVGDVNLDGKVNNIDATIILRYSVGSITELPYEA